MLSSAASFPSQRLGYVAYTATPFANLLINPSNYEDLYPRHFIVDLQPPADYFGAEKIFGRAPLDATDDFADDGLDIVRPVSDTDVAAVRPASRTAVATWNPSVPDSLAEALRWFVLATAARRARDGRASHSTMLVHTSMLTAAHSALQQCIRPFFDNLARALEANDNTVLTILEQQWTDETARIPAVLFRLPNVPWSEVRPRLSEVLSDLRVLVDNYQSADRLNYPEDDTANHRRHRWQHPLARPDPRGSRVQLLRAVRNCLRHASADGTVVRLPSSLR